MGKYIGNGVVWIFVFVFFIGYIFESVFVYVINNSDSVVDVVMSDLKYWFIMFVLNVGFFYFDEG